MCNILRTKTNEHHFNILNYLQKLIFENRKKNFVTKEQKTSRNICRVDTRIYFGILFALPQGKKIYNLEVQWNKINRIVLKIKKKRIE